jgi:hypothetical protein
MMITQREVCGCYETRSRGLPASERITSYNGRLSMSRSHWSRVFSFYFIALSLSAVVCCGCSALLFSAVFLFAL